MSANDHLTNAMRIFTEFDLERRMAHIKHGLTSMESQAPESHRRMTILTEEVGEVAEAYQLDPLALGVGNYMSTGYLIVDTALRLTDGRLLHKDTWEPFHG